MWAIIGILAAAAAIAFVEIPPLWKRRLKKEIACFSVFLILGIGLGIAKSLRMHIPNPLDLITIIFQPMSDAIFSLLK